MDLEQLLQVAVRGGASDIIIKTGGIPRFRFNGELIGLQEGVPVSSTIMDGWLTELLPKHLYSTFERDGDADFAYTSQGGFRFRVNLFKQRGQVAIAMRVVVNHVRTLAELQLPKALGSIALEKRGLVLVTGATGSGKSTTLAAMLQHINLHKKSHVVTIEDPIEVNFKDEQSTINQREIGRDCRSFSAALRATLRQDPDVILVGELRDGEATDLALKASETGHLVMTTLHTSSVAEALTRLLSYFPAAKQQVVRQTLSHTLRAVVSQRLVPRRDGRGQVAALEIMSASTAVQELVMDSTRGFFGLKDIMAKSANDERFCTFDQSLADLVNQRIISQEVALENASNPSDMSLKLRGVGRALK